MRAHPLPKNQTDESGTRERILAAAGPLFAKKGFEATGVRAIASAAEVNLAAVNYHFGSKDALIEAVSARHVNAVNDRRLAALASVLDSPDGAPPTVEAVVEAFIAPSVRFVHDADPANLLLMRLIINRAKGDPDNTGRRLAQVVLPTLKRFADALATTLPGTPLPVLLEGVHLVTGILLHEVSCVEMMAEICPENSRDTECVIRRLVAFGAAGVRGLAAR